MALWGVSLRYSLGKTQDDLPLLTAGPLRILPAYCPEAGNLPYYGFAIFFGNELIGIKGSHGYFGTGSELPDLTIDERNEMEARRDADLEEAKEFASGFVTHACFLHVKPYKPPTPVRERDSKGRFISERQDALEGRR